MPSTVKVRVKAARNLPFPETKNRTSSTQTPGGHAAGVAAATATAAAHNACREVYVVVGLGGQRTTNLAEDEELELASSETYDNRGRRQKPGYAARTRHAKRLTGSSQITTMWEEDFRFDVSDDRLLQEEPLIFKVCVRGSGTGRVNVTDSAEDGDECLGLVYVDLNPLLTAEADRNEEGDGTSPTTNSNSALSSSASALLTMTSGSQVDGWFPLYDTQSGVRGELCLSVKLNFIGDVNPFRESSAGVRLFPFSTLDPMAGFAVKHIFGFVEELVVADDPEFDTLRHQRGAALHESRQTVLHLLDASVRRRLAKTVLDMGGNAVLGYHQNFDGMSPISPCDALLWFFLFCRHAHEPVIYSPASTYSGRRFRNCRAYVWDMCSFGAHQRNSSQQPKPSNDFIDPAKSSQGGHSGIFSQRRGARNRQRRQ